MPIGATVLIVNRRHFELTKDEKMGTWVVGLIALALAGWGIYQRATYVPPKELPRPGAPLNAAPGQAEPAEGGLPQPAGQGQSRS